MTSRFPPFAFVELVSPYNKKNITRWLEDMNFMFSWQEQYLTRSLRSLVRYCSRHSNIKFISSRHRVISSIYLEAILCRSSKVRLFSCNNDVTRKQDPLSISLSLQIDWAKWRVEKREGRLRYLNTRGQLSKGYLQVFPLI